MKSDLIEYKVFVRNYIILEAKPKIVMNTLIDYKSLKW